MEAEAKLIWSKHKSWLRNMIELLFKENVQLTRTGRASK